MVRLWCWHPGSASPDRPRQASESLAGRKGIGELAPLSVAELESTFRRCPNACPAVGFCKAGRRRTTMQL